jgi:hypothetical protein
MALTQVKSDGIADGAVTTNDLSNSGVTAGTYGSSSAIPAITVDAKGRITAASTNAISVESDRIFEGNTSAEAVDTGSGGHFKVITEGTERARIDSSGRLLVGTFTSRDNWFNGSGQSPVIQSESSSSQNFFSGTYTSSGGGAAIALLGKARGTSYQVVNDADGLGRISFQGADGAQMVEAAFILAEVDGTPGANDMPGRLVFSTTADGASSPTERMRIDASGNITLPSGGNLGINGALPQSPLDVISNASSYGISLRGRSSDNVSQFRFVSNNHGSSYSLFEAAPTYLATHVNGSERVRIDSSGRVLVGTSSDRSNVPGASVGVLIEGASGGSTNKRFVQHIFGSGDGSGPYLGLGKHRGTSTGGNTLVVNGDELGGIYFQGADGSNFIQGASIISFIDGTPGANDMPGRLVFSTTADGASVPTERMRIGSDGNLRVGTASGDPAGAGSNGRVVVSAANGGQAALTVYNAGTGAVNIISLENGNGQVGRIQISGSTTSYLTSSDYRLKEAITPMTGALGKVAALKPCTYKWKVDGTNGEGFIAHELAEIVPACVGGKKDAVDDDGNPVYQGIDQSKLVPLLTAALQEAIGEIESLKARVAALEP